MNNIIHNNYRFSSQRWAQTTYMWYFMEETTAVLEVVAFSGVFAIVADLCY